jgi:preprotein translocase subunit SecY
MTAGTMFAIWLGELISEFGIRNQGLSLIIFSGIVAGIPGTLQAVLADRERWLFVLIFTMITTSLTIFAIVFVQQGRRNIPVLYPGRRVGARMSMPVRGTLPLMVNTGDPDHFRPILPHFSSDHRQLFPGFSDRLGGEFCQCCEGHFRWR